MLEQDKLVVPLWIIGFCMVPAWPNPLGFCTCMHGGLATDGRRPSHSRRPVEVLSQPSTNPSVYVEVWDCSLESVKSQYGDSLSLRSLSLSSLFSLTSQARSALIATLNTQHTPAHEEGLILGAPTPVGSTIPGSP